MLAPKWLKHALFFLLVLLSFVAEARVLVGAKYTENGSGQKYVVEKILGTGSFGTVVVAKRLTDGAEVVLKIFENKKAFESLKVDRQLISELMQDQLAVGKVVRSGNLVEANEELFKTPVIIQEMERMAGVNLEQVAASFRLTDINETPAVIALKLRALKKLASDLLEIQKVLIEHRLVHNDIKPANILLRPFSGEFTLERYVNGEISLALGDFDTMRRQGEKSGSGTIKYMGLERFTNPGGESRTGSDIFSLGMTLYELATGKSYLQELSGREKIYMSDLIKLRSEQLRKFFANEMTYIGSFEQKASGTNSPADPLTLSTLLPKLLEPDITEREKLAAKETPLSELAPILKEGRMESELLDLVFSACDALELGRLAPTQVIQP